MSQASEQIARQFANAGLNKSTWGDVMANVKAYGALGDGTTNDSPDVQQAINDGKTPLWFPYSATKYLLSTTVSANPDTTMILHKASQLNTAQTLEALHALVFTGGYVGGMPIATALRESKIEIVAGTIQQSTVDRTKWNYISNSLHVPVGVSGTYGTAAGQTITVPFAKTYSRVIALVAGPDETLASLHNFSVGASVGLDSIILSASGTIDGATEIYWDGASWVVASGTGQDLGITLSYSAGALTINHGFCRGINIAITPYLASGTFKVFMPVIFGAIGNGSVVVKFMDTTTGTYKTDVTPQVGMSLLFTKSFSEGLYLDGTNGSDTLALDQGNIWFYGILEV